MFNTSLSPVESFRNHNIRQYWIQKWMKSDDAPGKWAEDSLQYKSGKNCRRSRPPVLVIIIFITMMILVWTEMNSSNKRSLNCLRKQHRFFEVLVLYHTTMPVKAYIGFNENLPLAMQQESLKCWLCWLSGNLPHWCRFSWQSLQIFPPWFRGG